MFSYLYERFFKKYEEPTINYNYYITIKEIVKNNIKSLKNTEYTYLSYGKGSILIEKYSYNKEHNIEKALKGMLLNEECPKINIYTVRFGYNGTYYKKINFTEEELK